MNRIEFTLPDVGLREIEGMVWFEDGFIVLDVKNKLLGLIDEERDLIKIEPGALSDIYVARRLFKDRLVLVPKKYDLLQAVPGKHANELRLKVWVKKRKQLNRLIVDITAWRHAQQLEAASRTNALEPQPQSSDAPEDAP